MSSDLTLNASDSRDDEHAVRTFFGLAPNLTDCTCEQCVAVNLSVRHIAAARDAAYAKGLEDGARRENEASAKALEALMEEWCPVGDEESARRAWVGREALAAGIAAIRARRAPAPAEGQQTEMT